MTLRELAIFVLLGVYAGGVLVWFDEQRPRPVDAVYLLALFQGIAWLFSELAPWDWRPNERDRDPTGFERPRDH